MHQNIEGSRLINCFKRHQLCSIQVQPETRHCVDGQRHRCLPPVPCDFTAHDGTICRPRNAIQLDIGFHCRNLEYRRCYGFLCRPDPQAAVRRGLPGAIQLVRFRCQQIPHQGQGGSAVQCRLHAVRVLEPAVSTAGRVHMLVS